MKVSARAYAKLNLALEVLGRRADGYHDITSVMQTVSLCDELSFEHGDGVSLVCDDPAMRRESNLIFRAAQALQRRTGTGMGAVIGLCKEIPGSAGLGGGSSDAAVTLEALNRLWATGLGRDELAVTAAELGSDVPFFLYGGTCLVEGRGEIVTSLPDMRKAWFVLFKPPVAIPPKKTAALYGMFDKRHFTDGKRVEGLARLIQQGEATADTAFYNAFDEVADAAYAGISDYRMKFIDAGAGRVHLAGSGPVLFSMFQDEQGALAVSRNLGAMGLQAFTVASVAPDE